MNRSSGRLALAGLAAVLLEISNLGLRLADPCRELANANGHGSAWQPAGQESAYATSHALMLASSPVASSQWQARALPGVTDAEISAAISCPGGCIASGVSLVLWRGRGRRGLQPLLLDLDACDTK